MDEMNKIIDRDIPEEDGAQATVPSMTPTPDPNTKAAENVLKQVTGQDIDLDAAMKKQSAALTSQPEQVTLATEEKPKVSSSIAPLIVGDGEKKFVPEPPPQFMTVEEAQALGIKTDGGEELTGEENWQDAVRKANEQRAKLAQEDFQKMYDDVIGEEEARMQRLENTIALPDDDPRKQKLLGDRIQKVQETTVTQEDRDKDDRQSGMSGYDEDQLVPSYEEDENEIKKNTPEATDEAPDPESEEYADYVRNLEKAAISPTDKPVVITVREPMVIDRVGDPEKRSKKNFQPLGDQAFMNAITRFKNERFGKVTVPLVNSGFMCHIVGTGVVDLQNLYINVSEETRVYEYQMEQMRVVIRNITGTNPRVNPNELRNKIHYADFHMMAFGHLCATLKTVESVANCPECGVPFRITSKPSELLMNMDALHERQTQIMGASNIDSVSLMSKYKIITTSGGFEVTLGHPSYANEIALLNSFLSYHQNMTPADGRRFESMLQTLYMVRKIRLPNGIPTNTIYQNYMAINMMDTSDLQLINKEVEKMQKEIIRPEFGIREALCPHCKKIVKNIAYRNILDLLFLHTQLSGFLNQTAEGN